MIRDHLKFGAVLEPEDLQALQSKFDDLKKEFSLESSKDEKAALALLLIAAFRTSHSADQAAQFAGKIYRDYGLPGARNSGNKQPT